MINSYLKSPLSRPVNSNIYTNTRILVERYNLAQKHRKYKLMILVICRVTYRHIKQSFEQIQQTQRKMQQKINKICTLSQKNLNFSLYLAFKTIKKACTDNQIEEKIFKSAINLLQRIQKYKLKQCFNKLVLHTVRSNRNFISNLYSRRNINFHRKLSKIIKYRKKQAVSLIAAYPISIMSLKKVRIISVIHNRFEKQLKQKFFSRLSRFVIGKYSRSNTDQEVGNLKTQIEDMTVQLQNKKQNISRLQSQLAQIKVQQSNIMSQHNISYGQPNNNSKNKSSSVKRFSFNEYSIGNKSFNSNQGMNMNDVSIGSILGSLNKSRNGSVSRFDPATDCSCGYKARCKKYKTLNQSLKNQLEIVKEELQVAKDLNQHFTNEINNYLNEGNQVNASSDYQILKKQVKTLQDQRDQLREKVFKYQKHITNLKSQFKIKMEELYRKVRKDM